MLGTPGLVDIDLSHVLRLIKNGGGTFISLGYGQGDGRAILAIENALSHPLLEDIPINQAKGMIVKFSGAISVTEMQEAMRHLQSRTSPDTEILPALNSQERPDGQILVTMLATGIGATAIDYTPLPVENPAALPCELEPAALPMDFCPHAFDPAEKDIDDLEVPAFIRRGYNQINNQTYRNG